MRRFALACILTGLLACTPAATGPTKAQVAAIEVGVTEAETLALTYVRQPGITPEAKAKVLRDGQAAHDAVVTLRLLSTMTALAAATTALDTLRADIPHKE
jgi:hypothetical protein